MHATNITAFPYTFESLLQYDVFDEALTNLEDFQALCGQHLQSMSISWEIPYTNIQSLAAQCLARRHRRIDMSKVSQPLHLI